ncbi:bifunctional 3'-5' exonuclease/DNA polymerase [Antricoccus suffuscus]|uniref:bifunctional 3'-5' exonuclease/DNA polymerase n=1 Tax=Antricoccus suffuscus TaxID=1629062 RepID=UPI00192DF7D4|nr:bifunctional 3'-5' exonuclease/DNA polymerase [Antricoccus suffuscus]
MSVALGIDIAGDFWVRRTDESSAVRLAPADVAPTLTRIETAERPRWILPGAASIYPTLRELGVRLDRCHDVVLVEALLLAAEGRYGAPSHPAASLARLHGIEAPEARLTSPSHSADPEPLALFNRAALMSDADPASAAFEIYQDQVRRIAERAHPNAFGILCAADSLGALLAVEMTEAGIPWDAGVHDALLTDLLGERPRSGGRPPKMAALADQVRAAFNGAQVNPDSPADLIAAFGRQGVELESTRSWVIRKIDHPAIAPLLTYKELSRVHTANGWAWLHTWVRNGRFRPEYVPAGVVSGRWATRGGGALQIPRRLRGAVVADPGKTLVVADAAQLEPRVLAAMSGDPGMMRAAGSTDMYETLAAQAFGGDRAKAKIGLLGAMYGQVGGGAAAPLQVLRARYPRALRLLEDAAHAGERGGLVHSHLGRTSPPRSERDPSPAQERARGRFTRNFVVQATAAEWAESLLGILRQKLFAAYGDSDSARIVFYQHDEVIVHCDAELAEAVGAAIKDSADAASRLLFGDTPVIFLMEAKSVKSYAEAK